MATDLPDMEVMINALADQKCFDEKTVVIGHSLGSVLALRLAEKYQLGQLILVSGWDFNDLTVEHQKFWPNPINHELIKSHVGKIICVASDNDPYFTAFQTKEMSKRLGGDFLIVKGAGHFTEETYGITKTPEILKTLS